ncbi:MAG: YqeG family HAD IIIA-type phosphatase [Gloeocapsa sp. DLM2.Bin57]|nr:MAG: YqeG family HAD IIIA-type phosphatase [Gloeocapsa sp. DLM2.Bin57]
MVNRKLFRADLVLNDNIMALNPEILAKYQLKGLILDVDDTLVPFNSAHIAPEVITWIETIKEKAVIYLVSNNLSHNRIKNIAQTLQLPYIFGARKPSRRKLKQALNIMQLKPEEVAMVGDNILTDVLAGNRLGMVTILVQPVIYHDSPANLLGLEKLKVLFLHLLGVDEPISQQNLTKQDKSS